MVRRQTCAQRDGGIERCFVIGGVKFSAHAPSVRCISACGQRVLSDRLLVAMTSGNHVHAVVTQPIGTSSFSGRCTTWEISTSGVHGISSSPIRNTTVRNVRRLLLSLGKQLEQRGMRAQKVLLRGPFSLPPRPFAHFSAPSRCRCESHRSARLPLGSEIPPRSSVSVSPCGCLAPPGCCQRARSHRT